MKYQCEGCGESYRLPAMAMNCEHEHRSGHCRASGHLGRYETTENGEIVRICDDCKTKEEESLTQEDLKDLWERKRPWDKEAIPENAE